MDEESFLAGERETCPSLARRPKSVSLNLRFFFTAWRAFGNDQHCPPPYSSPHFVIASWARPSFHKLPRRRTFSLPPRVCFPFHGFPVCSARSAGHFLPPRRNGRIKYDGFGKDPGARGALKDMCTDFPMGFRRESPDWEESSRGGKPASHKCKVRRQGGFLLPALLAGRISLC